MDSCDVHNDAVCISRAMLWSTGKNRIIKKEVPFPVKSSSFFLLQLLLQTFLYLFFSKCFILPLSHSLSKGLTYFFSVFFLLLLFSFLSSVFLTSLLFNYCYLWDSGCDPFVLWMNDDGDALTPNLLMYVPMSLIGSAWDGPDVLSDFTRLQGIIFQRSLDVWFLH